MMEYLSKPFSEENTLEFRSKPFLEKKKKIGIPF
jgi:hypothetical protein